MVALKLFFLAVVGFASIASIGCATALNYYNVPGHPMEWVTISRDYMWGLDGNEQIFVCRRPCTNGAWIHKPGHLKQIDSDDDYLWGVNRFGNIWRTRIDGSGPWIRVAGGLQHVSASGNGYIWGTNPSGYIFTCRKPCDSSNWVFQTGLLKQVDGGQTDVYGVTTDNRIQTKPIDGSGSWRVVPGKSMKYVTVGTTNIYTIDDQNNIYKCELPCYGDYELVDDDTMQADAIGDSYIAVDPVCNVFVIVEHR